MNEGSLVWMTSCPLMAPTIAANTIVATMATGRGQCALTNAAANARPAKAIMDPIERSNSPPIIRRAAAIAKMPSCEAGARIVISPLSVNIVGLAVRRKKMRTTISPAIAPSSGLRIASVTIDVFRRRSSTWTAAAAGAMASLGVFSAPLIALPSLKWLSPAD